MSTAPLPAALGWLAFTLAAAAIVDAVRRADWQAPAPELTKWAIATVLLLLARQLTITMPGGISLAYLGTAWLTLLLGYPRAVVSAAAILALDALRRPRAFDALGLELLLFVVVSAWLMWVIAHTCRRRLPPNPFIFLIGVAFLGLFVAYALPLLAAAALGGVAIAFDSQAAAGATGVASAHTLGQYLRLAVPYALLLAAGEAWLEGMLTTLLVVYVPGSVRLFDDAYYLR